MLALGFVNFYRSVVFEKLLLVTLSVLYNLSLTLFGLDLQLLTLLTHSYSHVTLCTG